MNERLPFAIWGALLALVVLAVAFLDEHLLRRLAYVLIGAGMLGLLLAANWAGEELCVREDCRPETKSKFGLRLASLSLVALGLAWYDLIP